MELPKMSYQKYIVLIVLVVAVVGSVWYLDSHKSKRTDGTEIIEITPGAIDEQISGEENELTRLRKKKASQYVVAKEITTPDGFINTANVPISIGEFVGKKVVLVDFWTYSCINCQRTTPYLNSWYEKYKDQGLVIIGIHTPEFAFEKVYENVLEATKKMGIEYPVVLDNDYSTWKAYENRFWPRKYLIDIDGYIIYDHIGEGQYEETEKKIQEALKERMLVLREDGSVDRPLTQEPEPSYESRSPETYFGASRNESFKNGQSGVVGDQFNLTLPQELADHYLYLAGDWRLDFEFAENKSSEARVAYKYSAKNVFLVAEASSEISVEVLIDGAPLGTEAGEDVTRTPEGRTFVKIRNSGLYKIIEDNKTETHKLELIIPEAGVRAYTFTFG